MRTTLPPLHSGTQADRAAHMLRSMAALGIDTAGAAGLTGDPLDAWIEAALDADFEKEFAAELVKRHAAAAVTAPPSTTASYCDNLPNPSAPVVALAQACHGAFLTLRDALPYRTDDPERFAASFDWQTVFRELHAALREAGHPAGK